MREKLLDLMKNEGLKPSQLAEMLEINPAGISHILAGRNKPGFDLLQKILRRFPQINPDWLLLDSAKMYRTPEQLEQTDDNTITATTIGRAGNRSTTMGNGELFDITGSIANPAAAGHRTSGPSASGVLPGGANSDDTRIHERAAQMRTSPAGKAAVEKIVVCYEDGTFDSYTSRHE